MHGDPKDSGLVEVARADGEAGVEVVAEPELDLVEVQVWRAMHDRSARPRTSCVSLTTPATVGIVTDSTIGRPRTVVADLPSYRPGKGAAKAEAEHGITDAIKLASNAE